MRNKLLCLCMIATIILSCSKYHNSTPDEFGNSLVEILKEKDTLAFNNLQMKMEDLIRVIEDDPNTTEAQKKISVGILEQGGIGPMKTINLDKNWNKRLDNFYSKAEKYYGISDWEKIKFVKVLSRDLEEPGDKYMISIYIDYEGYKYILKCLEVYKVSTKGFMFLNHMPVLHKI